MSHIKNKKNSAHNSDSDDSADDDDKNSKIDREKNHVYFYASIAGR